MNSYTKGEIASIALKSLKAVSCAAIVGSLSLPVAQAQQLPDLRISAISTPGGICNQQDVRVTVVNSQQVGVSESIPVILTVSQPPNQPFAVVGNLANGIGPNANSGRPLFFRDLNIDTNGGPITLKAHVNPDLEIQETVFNNNVRVQSVNCSPSSTISSANRINWSLIALNQLNRPIRDAVFSVNGEKKYTDKNGIAKYSLTPGSYTVSLSKKGCSSVKSSISTRTFKSTGKNSFKMKGSC